MGLCWALYLKVDEKCPFWGRALTHCIYPAVIVITRQRGKKQRRCHHITGCEKAPSPERIQQLPGPPFRGTPVATGSINHAPKECFQPVTYLTIDRKRCHCTASCERLLVARGATQLCEDRDWGWDRLGAGSNSSAGLLSTGGTVWGARDTQAHSSGGCALKVMERRREV